MTKPDSQKVDDRFAYLRGKPWADSEQIRGKVLFNLRHIGSLKFFF